MELFFFTLLYNVLLLFLSDSAAAVVGLSEGKADRGELGHFTQL